MEIVVISGDAAIKPNGQYSFVRISYLADGAQYVAVSFFFSFEELGQRREKRMIGAHDVQLGASRPERPYDP